MTRIPVTVVLNNIRSLHNVGAIFRSCDAINAEKIVLTGLTPVPERHEISKTALGATKTVPWEYQATILPCLEAYRQLGYTIYALEQTPEASDIFTTNLKLPAVLIVGHEREGVEAAVLAHCDAHLELPMDGQSAHSLNVSTSTTVALYQFRAAHLNAV